MHALGPTLTAVATLLLVAGPAAEAVAQSAPDGRASFAEAPPDAPLVVEADLPPEDFVGQGHAVTLRPSRPLAAEERLAVFLGETDATALFRTLADGSLRYEADVLSLPSGERDLIVYRVAPGAAWEEVARVPLRVRGNLGFDRSRLSPRVDLGLEGRLAEGHEPADQAPLRSTYQDVTGQLALETEAERGSLRWTSQASVLGVSRRENALRFGELAGDAPRVDLSDYLVRLGTEATELSVGHVSMGDQPHLISGFSSRGSAFALTPGSRVELRAGVVNGSSIVGWANPVGLAEPDHRIVTGSLGLEALSRPGGLRVELSGLSGSVLPLGGFNQGVVNDAEESRGLGVRVLASDPSERLRLEAGFARSTFDNPPDPTLEQDAELVPVEEVTKNARYVDASVDLLRDLRLGATRTANLSIGYRHERVDPLYRSLGAYAAADRLDDQWEARAVLAGIALHGTYGRSRDNLGDVRSILTTRTHRTGAGTTVPLGSLGGGAPVPWLPTLSYGLDRTRQFGEGVPEEGGFDPSHVPDQVSLNHTVSADWQWRWLTLGYRLNASSQDNRQPGREAADFSSLVNGIAMGLAPLASLSFDLSLDFERAENEEADEVDRTRRVGVRSSWRPYERGALSLSVSRTDAGDRADTRDRKDTVLDANWSASIPGLSLVGGQYYLRFSRVLGEAVDRTFELDQRTEQWSLNSGVNLSLF